MRSAHRSRPAAFGGHLDQRVVSCRVSMSIAVIEVTPDPGTILQNSGPKNASLRSTPPWRTRTLPLAPPANSSEYDCAIVSAPAVPRRGIERPYLDISMPIVTPPFCDAHSAA